MTRDSDVPPTDRGGDTSAPTQDLEVDRGDSLLRRIANMTPRAPARELAVGTLVDATYRIERRLGAGGMGVVYLARDTKLDRDVALKLHLGAADERLAREAKAIASLVDPNVVTVHEIGVFEGHPFVAMEYLDGGTARTWLADADRTTGEILALYLAAARGLAAAHRAGLVHRDFKPDNVLVGRDGRIRVADFGLVGVEPAVSTSAAIATSMTMTGAVLGTPAYMAPEQHAGAKIGPVADQFAFCVSLWEALFGHRPFQGADIAALQRAITAGPPRPPRGHHVSASAIAALQVGLAADPAARWPSMTALASALAPATPRRLAPIFAVVVAALVAGGAVALAMRDSSTDSRIPDAGVAVAIADANVLPTLGVDAALAVDAAVAPQSIDAAAIDAASIDARAARPAVPAAPRACTTNGECKENERCHDVEHVCMLAEECEPAFVVTTEHEADEAFAAIHYSTAQQLYVLIMRCKPALALKALTAACKGQDPKSAKDLFTRVPRSRRAQYAKACRVDGIELE